MNKQVVKCFGANILKRFGIIDFYDSWCKSLLILMYHRVNSYPDCLGLTLSPELFTLQLQYLKEHFEVICLGDAISRISSGVFTGNCCVITFDDGYRDNYQIASPLLAKLSIPATIFVTYDAIQTGHFGWETFDRTLLTTKHELLDLHPFGLGRYPLVDQAARELAVISLHRLLKQRSDAEKQSVVEHVVASYGDAFSGERSMMSWDEVSELANGGLVSIGAHTITHPILSRVSLEQARNEVVEAKRLIEMRIGRSVDYFAYPNGRFEDIGEGVLSLVKEAGYYGACTTIAGRNAAGHDPFMLRRVDVTSAMSTDRYGRFSPELFSLMTSGLLYQR